MASGALPASPTTSTPARVSADASSSRTSSSSSQTTARMLLSGYSPPDRGPRTPVASAYEASVIVPVAPCRMNDQLAWPQSLPTLFWSVSNIVTDSVYFWLFTQRGSFAGGSTHWSLVVKASTLGAKGNSNFAATCE